MTAIEQLMGKTACDVIDQCAKLVHDLAAELHRHPKGPATSPEVFAQGVVLALQSLKGIYVPEQTGALTRHPHATYPAPQQ